MDEKTLRTIDERLVRLEKAVFSQKKGKSTTRLAAGKNFEGPSGGVRFLISQGFFRTKRGLADVRAALAKNDYQYVAPVVQTALNRQATRTGPLATFKEGGKKMYVKRK
jgi:hypothetical protein